MISNWGNIPKVVNTEEKIMLWRDQPALFEKLPVLAHGNGRSYGDVALNNNGVVISTTHLNRFMEFDAENGILMCESGCLLSDILSFCVPTGWMLPVVPGTKFITVGGAIANDVHGKNHHKRGTFGFHLKQIAVMRSTGETIQCSLTKNSEFFSATIGGIGLTGLILWAEIQLMPITSSYLSVTTQSFYGIKEFIALSNAAEKTHEFTVAWLDCQSSGKNFARGLLMKANFCSDHHFAKKPARQKMTAPFFMPSCLLNSFTMRTFNHLYFYSGAANQSEKIIHYDAFFFPLDAIHHWNKIYGKRGFYQYQCVVPMETGVETIMALLNKIVESKQGSFLSVLKVLGDQPSVGILSFPMPGITLALDFPNQGDKTIQLLNALDTMVIEAKGRVYLAKDARLNAAQFHAYYEKNWEKFLTHKDVGFSSSLFERVNHE